jgi:hypothetical protein
MHQEFVLQLKRPHTKEHMVPLLRWNPMQRISLNASAKWQFTALVNVLKVIGRVTSMNVRQLYDNWFENS